MKWPSTAIWQRVEETFRLTHGRSWRRAAASVLKCRKPALRATIDIDYLTRTETDAIDAILIEHLQRRVRRCLRNISAAEQLICRVRHANDGRGCEIETPIDLSGPDLPIDPNAPMSLTQKFLMELLEEEPA